MVNKLRYTQVTGDLSIKNRDLTNQNGGLLNAYEDLSNPNGDRRGI